MSKVQRTYRVWNGCGWTRVSTSEAVWRATPRFRGILTGCGAAAGVIGGGIALAWPHGQPDGSHGLPFNAYGHGGFPGLEEYQHPPATRGQEGGLLPATYGSGPNSGVGVWQAPPGYHFPCPEPTTAALLGIGLLFLFAFRKLAA